MKITDTMRSTAYESVTSEKKSTQAPVKQKKKQEDTFELSGDSGTVKTAAGGMSASSGEDQLGISKNNAIVARQQGDAMEDTADNTAKAMRIMARIASGKRVPMKDKEFLMKYDPKLYGEAESIGAIARMHKKKKDDKVEGEKDDEEKKPKEDYAKEIEDLTISHTNTTLEVSIDGGEATTGDVSSETIE